jgi:hypothetical protein
MLESLYLFSGLGESELPFSNFAVVGLCCCFIIMAFLPPPDFKNGLFGFA